MKYFNNSLTILNEFEFSSLRTQKLLNYKMSFLFWKQFFNLLRDLNRTYLFKLVREITLFYTVSNPAKYHKNIYRISSLMLLDTQSLHWFCKKLIYRMVSCVSISLVLRKLIFYKFYTFWFRFYCPLFKKLKRIDGGRSCMDLDNTCI